MSCRRSCSPATAARPGCAPDDQRLERERFASIEPGEIFPRDRERCRVRNRVVNAQDESRSRTIEAEDPRFEQRIFRQAVGLGERGLERDRGWVLVDGDDGLGIVAGSETDQSGILERGETAREQRMASDQRAHGVREA